MQHWLKISLGSMENWLEINGRRKSFLIGAERVTQTQVYRMRSIFEQIEGIIAIIEGLLKNSKVDRYRLYVKHQIEEEYVYLIIIYEFLKEIVGNNKKLEHQFIFDMIKTKNKIGNILEKTVHLVPS